MKSTAIRGPRPARFRRRLRSAKFSFNTRRVPRSAYAGLRTNARPSKGDLVLARVDSLGQHPRLQLPNGRRSTLYPGDEIVLCYGNRYAVNQWEALVPPTLEPCDLVAAGGVAGRVRSRHAKTKRPTRISPQGLLTGADGQTLNIRDFALEPRTDLTDLPPVIAVVGTGMDAGKTTAASSLIHGLSLAGYRVAGTKITGTGACGDYWQMKDSGAAIVSDFVDAGHVSTYKETLGTLESIYATLFRHAADAGANVIVAEIADGVVQTETEALLESQRFLGVVSGVLLAAADAMGASAALGWLRQRGVPVQAISGMVSASMLGAREAEIATGLPVFGILDLWDPARTGAWAGILAPDGRWNGNGVSPNGRPAVDSSATASGLDENGEVLSE